MPGHVGNRSSRLPHQWSRTSSSLPAAGVAASLFHRSTSRTTGHDGVRRDERRTASASAASACRCTTKTSAKSGAADHLAADDPARAGTGGSAVRDYGAAIAIVARKSGTVVLEATVGPDGAVRSVRVVKSEPLLDNAALDAVKQWRYQPLQLNGRAHPFILTVTVSFNM
jgi:TonB family protein